MPYGHFINVALVSWGVACALTRWRWAGPFAWLPALVVSEVPFLVGALLVGATAITFAEGDLDSPAAVASAVVALLALAGLAVVVRRATLAHAALHNAGKPRRSWSRILLAPFFARRRDVVVARGLAYGDGKHRTLDVYHHRERPSGAPILLNLHGGAFRSGDKAREARPLMRELAANRGFVCVSANYRLQPRVTLADQVADVRAALAWIRVRASEYGGNADSLFVTGSSAGAYLAIRAAGEEPGAIKGLIGRYGYYGKLAPRDDLPPMLIIHGEKDILVPASDAHAFAERVGAVYAELPGAHHVFDMFESVRSAAINEAIVAFIATLSVGAREPRARG
jgi:acetyl esterase/lipase